MTAETSSEDIHGTVVKRTYWWGDPTLLGAEHDPDPAACDIGLVGVPHSIGNGTTERDQRLGPRAVRHVSGLLGRRVHSALRVDPWQRRICEMGDVPLPEANDNEACIARITKHDQALAVAGVRPVSIGGDHPIIVLCGSTGGAPVGLLHIDAHTDMSDKLDHFLGAKDSAAHWGSFLVREGHVDPARSIQIGLRGHTRTLDRLEPSRALGCDVVTMAEFREIGLAAACARVAERLGEGPVYITFDLDSLDPTVAPAVSNLEPGVAGVSMDEAMALLRAARGTYIIGGDVVCPMPTKDSPNTITAQTAGYLMFGIACLIVDRQGAAP